MTPHYSTVTEGILTVLGKRRDQVIDFAVGWDMIWGVACLDPVAGFYRLYRLTQGKDVMRTAPIGCVLCFCLLASSCSSLNQTNPFSESHEWFGDGLPQLWKVSDRLYTGGQPSQAGLAKLKQMGVRTVINVRESDNSDRRDGNACKKLGLRYVYLPIPSGGPLPDETVEQFFRIVRDEAQCPVLVHCLTGRDRTVTLAALYRIAEEGWTADKAYEEMIGKEFNATLLNFSEYVYAFAQRRVENSAQGGRPSR